MKPNNLLIAADGELKLADFGLARTYGEPTGNMSPQVVTRWYRAPELLFGARDYSYGVDMWAVGCIFAELMLRVPYMAGETDIEQLQTIFRALGSPTDKEWPVGLCEMTLWSCDTHELVVITGHIPAHEEASIVRAVWPFP